MKLVEIGILRRDQSPQRHHTLKDYLDIKPAVVAGVGVARPRLVSLQVAVLARAQGKSNNQTLEASPVYPMLGQELSMIAPDSSSGTKSGYIRKVYGTTIALRNGRGE